VKNLIAKTILEVQVYKVQVLGFCFWTSYKEINMRLLLMSLWLLGNLAAFTYGMDGTTHEINRWSGCRNANPMEWIKGGFPHAYHTWDNRWDFGANMVRNQ